MMAIALLYHDVISGPDLDASGFLGPGATRYKLSLKTFEQHLDLITLAQRSRRDDVSPPSILTFDDGGVSAFETIAPALERRQLRGIFFIVSNVVGKKGFVDRAQLAELHRRGHVIGTHSASHPPRMAALSRAAIVEEWKASVSSLEDALGVPVRVGSVPNGYTSPLVEEAASAAGLCELFTSEPTVKTHALGPCLVRGRFSVHRATSMGMVRALASQARWPRVWQSAEWTAKGALKRVGGETYLRLRTRLLKRTSPRSADA